MWNLVTERALGELHCATNQGTPHPEPTSSVAMRGSHRRLLGLTALLLLIGVTAAIYLTRSTSQAPPESIAAAQRAISGLHYPIELDELQPDLLLGHVHNDGRTFSFLLYVDARSQTPIGRPGFEGGSLTEGYALFSPVHVPGESQRQESERLRIQSDIEEALCRQATHEPCSF